MSMKRDEIIGLIDPEGKRPILKTKTDKELVVILKKLHIALYEFRQEHYMIDAETFTAKLMAKERELLEREATLEFRENEFTKRVEADISRMTGESSKVTGVKREYLPPPPDPEIRAPDPVVRRQLIGGPPTPPKEKVSDIPIFDEAEILEAKRRSEMEFVEAEKERKEQEDAMKMSTDEIFSENPPPVVNIETGVVNFDALSEKPEGLSADFLEGFYVSLKEQDFVTARKILQDVSLPHTKWILDLKYKGKTLRTKITGKDVDSYMCLSPDA